MSEELILVVDDEIANLQKLHRTFINQYRVLSATSGREALNLVQNNGNIAVIIADQRMPDMTGVDFLKQTLDSLPHAVRIILTGYTDVDVLLEAINRCRVYRYMVKPWDPPDLLMTVARGLENSRLTKENENFRRELIRRERLARELEIAREIQRYILPHQIPTLDRFEIAVEYHPAQEVGGDLYDFEWDAPNLQLVIGDVSGKSIPSALYGAVFSGQLQTLLRSGTSPADTLMALNNNLLTRYQSGNFIAVTYCRIHEDGSGLLTNGGMPFPFLIHNGVMARLELSGVPLGLLEETVYDELSFHMDPEDTLILASDGVADALNKEGNFYDQDHFKESMKKHYRKELPEMLRYLYAEILQFVGDAEISDDITILGLRRREKNRAVD
jgi:serine phosphatase RsbU (regulator of sigma subunit)